MTNYTVTVSPSTHHEGRINIIISAKTFEACQGGVFDVMDEASQATFTLPVKTAEGEWVCMGHSEK